MNPLTPKLTRLIFIILSLMFIGALMGYQFLRVYNYPATEWWYQHGNDIDGIHVTTSLSLLNGAEYRYLYHPAATITMLQTMALRAVMPFNAEWQIQWQGLSEVSQFEASLDAIQSAMVVCRWMVLVVALCFLVVLFMVLLKLTKNRLLTFFMCFYIMTCAGMMYHFTVIRAEMLSLLFFLSALLAGCSYGARNPLGVLRGMGYSLLIGITIAFAVYSKIQIVPPLVVFACAALVYLFVFAPTKWIEGNTVRRNGLSVALALLNLLILPRWALERPDFLTSSYLQQNWVFLDLDKIYGYAPTSFTPVAQNIFLGLLLAALILFGLSFRVQHAFMKRLALSVFLMNGILLGAMFATYLILIPASVSIEQYFQNTQNLLYTTITNTFSGGYVRHRIFDGGTFQKIFGRLEVGSFLNISLGYLTIAALGLSLIHVIRKSTHTRSRLVWVFLFFGTGILLDVLGTMRAPTYYSYYFIYTITFYGLGLAIWLSFEWRQVNGHKRWEWLKGGILLAFLLHTVMTSVDILAQPEIARSQKQTLVREFELNKRFVQPFWEIVDRSIKRKESMGLASQEPSQDIWQEAIAQYTTNIETQPQEWENYYQRAKAYYYIGNYKDALQDFNEALALKSHHPSIYYDRARTLDQLGQSQEALNDYTRALQLKPDMVLGYYNRAGLLKRFKHYELAVQDYTRAIQLKADYDFAYNNRANLYSLMGKNEEAIEDYSKALAINPDLTIVYYNRGNSYMALGRLEEAKSDYDRLLKIEPSFAQAYEKRAMIHFSHKDFQASQKDLLKARELGHAVNQNISREVANTLQDQFQNQ